MVRTAAVAGALMIVVVSAASAQRSTAPLKCVPQRSTENRPSPYDSLHITIGQQHAVLCFSRPATGGRTMIGGAAVPYGKLWRTGANEPTIIHLGFAAQIAGVAVEPGSYSIYTIPSETEWEVVVNRSIAQWGIERQYTSEIKAQEVGRGTVRSEKLPQHVEKLTFRTERAAADSVDLVLEWEKTAVRIPIRVM